MAGDLAEATREGDVSFDTARLQRGMDKAGAAMNAGKQERARALYAGVIDSAEQTLTALALAAQARELKDRRFPAGAIGASETGVCGQLC